MLATDRALDVGTAAPQQPPSGRPDTATCCIQDVPISQEVGVVCYIRPRRKSPAVNYLWLANQNIRSKNSRRRADRYAQMQRIDRTPTAISITI